MFSKEVKADCVLWINNTRARRKFDDSSQENMVEKSLHQMIKPSRNGWKVSIRLDTVRLCVSGNPPSIERLFVNFLRNNQHNHWEGELAVWESPLVHVGMRLNLQFSIVTDLKLSKCWWKLIPLEERPSLKISCWKLMIQQISWSLYCFLMKQCFILKEE